MLIKSTRQHGQNCGLITQAQGIELQTANVVEKDLDFKTQTD